MARVRESAFPVNEEILERWSPRSFADRPVETSKLQRLFEAARLTVTHIAEKQVADFAEAALL